jgi:hypothetical protein
MYGADDGGGVGLDLHQVGLTFGQVAGGSRLEQEP